MTRSTAADKQSAIKKPRFWLQPEQGRAERGGGGGGGLLLLLFSVELCFFVFFCFWIFLVRVCCNSSREQQRQTEV
jgi:hypothetical protein